MGEINTGWTPADLWARKSPQEKLETLVSLRDMWVKEVGTAERGDAACKKALVGLEASGMLTSGGVDKLKGDITSSAIVVALNKEIGIFQKEIEEQGKD